MKFGPVPLDQALGAILAHSVAIQGGRLRKGRVLTEQDLETLRAAGVTMPTVARLEPGDIGEDAAAERLAQALVPDPARAGLRLGKAATGRVNIHAEAPGVIEVLADRGPEIEACVRAVWPELVGWVGTRRQRHGR